jgi:hypothetical protein
MNLPSVRIDAARLGDVETRKPITTYSLGTGLRHQQVGNVWNSPDTIVSLSFSGDLNVFDRRSGEKRPVKVLHVRDEITPKVGKRDLIYVSVIICRAPRKPSRRRSQTQLHRRRSSSDLPTAASFRTILREKPLQWQARDTQTSFPGSHPRLTARSSRLDTMTASERWKAVASRTYPVLPDLLMRKKKRKKQTEDTR